MRLIDADKLMKDIIGICKCRPSLEGRQKETVYIKDVIENQPTAYDVDKVIKELESLVEDREEDIINDEYTYGECLAYESAIRVVKRGGLDETKIL